NGAAFSMDLRDHLVLPGLINSHDHLHLNAFPQMPLGAPPPNSYAWIDRWSHFMSNDSVRSVRAIPESTRFCHGALKNILAGATTVAHHDPVPARLRIEGLPIRLAHAHWAHSLKLGREPDSDPFPTYAPAVQESYRATPTDMPWIIHLAEGTDSLAASELSRLA